MRCFIQRVPPANGTVFKVLDSLCRQLYHVNTVAPFPIYRLHKESGNITAARIMRIALPSSAAYSVSCTDVSFSFVLNEKACIFHGINRSIRGNIAAKNYDIMNADSEVIAAVSRSSTDSVEINIFDESSALSCICIAICFMLSETVDKLCTQPV